MAGCTAALVWSFIAQPTAAADDNDAAFLTALDRHGIKYGTRDGAIASGHLVCSKINGGETATQVAQDVMGNSNLDGYHAGYFVGASIAAYCPQVGAGLSE
ncbi:DUF732 domain-containing protein [Mycobacterium sp.]|uniref:DUF732 domain-containing protein n=1 Tax=Mycobacterium sp. TaxID=1785 RepID=UPI003C77D8EB